MMANGTGQQRPLSELSPVAQRRNSPIWNQNTKKMASSSPSSRDGSPFGASASMRLYWKGRDSPSNQGSENRQPYGPEAALQTSRRASLENLKRVSRVRNSRIIAREQNNENDPPQASSPQRPLAAGRLSQKVNQNDVVHETQQVAANDQPNDDIATENVARPASRDQASPAKSSLSKGSRFGQNATSFDPETEIWLDGQRHLKSVTFDAAPPQINEYEMSTPDPSTIASGSHDGSYDSEEDEGEISFDQDSSIDRDDSFDASLEDVEKTPVVLPEDWRFMSPDSENDEVVHQEDVENHDGDSPEHSRVEGQDSNSERRPLPPLPSTRMLASSRPSSAGMPSSGLDQADIKQRALPPRPGSAPYGQFDGSKLKEAMSLEDKLRLMALGENAQENERSDSAEGNEEHMAKENNSTTDEHTKKDTQMMKTDDHAGSGMGGLDRLDVDSPRISRESILRDIRKGDSFSDDSFEYSSQVDSSIQHYDPDVAIPSVEDENEDTNASVDIKDEENDDEDVYAIPDYYDDHHDENHAMGNEHYADDDNQSQYSRDSALEYQEQTAHHSNASDDSQTTAIAAEQSENHADRKFANTDKQEPHNEDAAAPETPERPETPPGRVDNPPNNEPSTPDSVIRHSAERDDSPPKESVPDPVATVKAPGGKLKTRPSLTPADMASMAATRRKISGQHDPPMPPLEKQPSNESQKSENSNASPDHKKDPLQDAPQLLPSAKNERQRQSSLVKLDIPFSIQEESLGFGLDKEFDRVIETQKVAFEQALSQIQPKIPSALAATHARQPRNPQETNHDSSGLAADPPIPKQRGYLMRQNTKVIVASSDADDVPAPPGDGTPAAAPGPRPGPTPRKPSQQTWTKVPWNSQPRRSSIKMGGSAIPRKKPVAGPVPPLPGQKSNVQDAQEAIAAAEENDPALNQTFEEGEERGRMFVKVVGIKYLDLPLPKGERSYFALTLDNGLHCVTTSWLELGKSAPIGQEFELIVQNDLEFQLTLQMKVDDSKFKAPEAAAPSPSRQKASTLSRVFASPRKRKEMELKNQMMQQQQREIDPNPGIWDKLRTLIAPDGSFGRSYVALSDHEKNAFGRPYTFDVSCFNEWAADDQMSSVKSKKSTTSNCSQRRPPYKIGKLELQLLFVPRPKGAKDEDMPKSMNACIREMRDAENVASRSFEGFLSQQGGDCPYWRRRFFKLQGSKLTAFHETSRQPRATINLAKAAKLIDDKSILTQRETSTRGGGRRKSAFAEEEEGYMFVEEGFRIRFGNGEVIDFYADSATEKENWMNVLADAVGKGSSSTSSQAKAWTEVVLKHEKHMQAKRDAGVLPARPLGNGGGAGPVRPATPSTPRKDAGPSPAPGSAAFARSPAQAQPPASFLPRPGHKHAYSQPEARSVDTRKQKTRSLLF